LWENIPTFLCVVKIQAVGRVKIKKKTGKKEALLFRKRSAFLAKKKQNRVGGVKIERKRSSIIFLNSFERVEK